jgi:hypothetical protein
MMLGTQRWPEQVVVLDGTGDRLNPRSRGAAGIADLLGVSAVRTVKKGRLSGHEGARLPWHLARWSPAGDNSPHGQAKALHPIHRS